MFLLIPVGVQYTARRYPVVTFTIMGLNTALYLLSLAQFWLNIQGTPESREWLVLHLGLVPNQMTWYTFLTSMFVHGGFLHVLGNMVYLFLFGSCVEDLIGRWQFSTFYLLGGLAANAVYLIAMPSGEQGDIPLVGASGAITACIGGYVLLLAKTKINFRYLFLFLFRFYSGDFWLPAWLVISFWFLKDLVWAVLSYQNPAAHGGVAFAAHVGGFIGGLAMMGGWKLWRRGRPIQTEEPADVTGDSPAIYLFQDGVQHGPFSPAQVSQMVSLGSFRDDAVYWREGMPDWRVLSEFGRE